MSSGMRTRPPCCCCAVLALRLLLLPLAAHGANNAESLTPTMGFNTWESYGCDISEQKVHAAAEAMVSKGLVAAGYTYLNLDDCWMAAERSSEVVALNATLRLNNTLQPSANFSSGMKALGDYLHGKGLKYGIYESSGTKTCQQYAGTLGHEWTDAQTFAAWGVDFVKYDDCFHEQYTEPARYPGDMPPILRYPLMGLALNKTGRGMSYMCNFPWQLWGMKGNAAMGGAWVPEFCNSWRTCGDPGPGFDNAVGYLNCWEQWADQIPSGPGGWATLDAVEIGNGKMTLAEMRAVFSLYALVKTPLYIGGDVVALSGAALQVYKNLDVIKINQDPLGAPGRNLRPAGHPGGELWGGPLAGGEAVALLLNRGESAINASLAWSDVGLKGSVSGRELWTGEEIGPAQAGITRVLAAHSALVYRLAPKST